MLMNFVLEYSDNKRILFNINIVRQYKGVLLPLEIVSPRGNQITDYYINKEE